MGRPAVIAGLVAAAGIAFSLSGAVVFSTGWEQSGALRWLICGIGLFLIAASLFAFAEGWDRYKALKNSGSIRGLVVWPEYPPRLRRDARVELRTQDGEISASTVVAEEGSFDLNSVPDGVWSLTVAGRWIEPIVRELRLQRRERLDLGPLPAKFDASTVLSTERLPLVGHLQSYAEDATGTEWAVGFATKEHRNSRIVLSRERGKNWTERIIPCLAKAERGEFVKLLRAGEIVVGSIDAGGCYSRDAGITWNPMKLPNALNSVSSLLQLPDHSIVASLWNYRGGYSPSGHVARYASLDSDPILHWSCENRQIETFHLTSTGRLLLATSGSEAGIYFSEDYGVTWRPSELPKVELAYGRFGNFVEVDGYLLAIFRPVGFGDSLCVRSSTDGLSWDILAPPLPTTHLCGFAAVTGGVLGLGASALNRAPMLVHSANNGDTWEPVLRLDGTPTPHGHIGEFAESGSTLVFLCMNSLTKLTADAKPSKFE